MPHLLDFPPRHPLKGNYRLRRSTQHLLKSAPLVLLTGAVSALLGLLTARTLVFSNATVRLTGFAGDLLHQDERMHADLNATLASGNASTFPFCSDEDITLLRNLLFRSPYVKNVGRIHNGFYLCSAVTGPLPRPKPMIPHIDLTDPSGNAVYLNAALSTAKGHYATVMAQGNTDIVLAPDVFANFYRPPLFFTIAFVDPAHHQFRDIYSNAPSFAESGFLKSGQTLRKNGILYYSLCSAQTSDCVLAGVPIAYLWHVGRLNILAAFLATFAIGTFSTLAALVFTRRSHSLTSQLRRAVRARKLAVVYQPIIDLDSQAIVGCEALARWLDEDGKLIGPDVFIPLAEEHGFIGDITRFVLETVVQDLGDVLLAHPGLRATVNLSAHDLTDPDLLPTLARILATRSIPASSIGLELTERSTADRAHAVKVIHQLRSRGHVIYVDDFGTGYSSLSYLTELAVDFLKVDRAFTSTIGTSSVTASIIPQILAMARALNLRIVFEGVEREDQATYLANAESGVHAQGWFFGRPISAHDLRSLLTHPAPGHPLPAPHNTAPLP